MSVTRTAVDHEKASRELLEIIKRIDEYEQSRLKASGLEPEELDVESILKVALKLLNEPVRLLKKIFYDELICGVPDKPSCTLFYATAAVLLWHARKGDQRAKKVVAENYILRNMYKQLL